MRGKNLSWASLIVLVTGFLVFSPHISKAQAVNENIWQGSVTAREGEILSVEQVDNRYDCLFQDVYTRKFSQPINTVLSAVEIGNFTLENKGRKCVLDNNQGVFTPLSFSPDGRTTYELSAPYSAVSWKDPAPSGDVLLAATKRFAGDLIYNLSIEPYFVDNSELSKGPPKRPVAL